MPVDNNAILCYKYGGYKRYIKGTQKVHNLRTNLVDDSTFQRNGAHREKLNREQRERDFKKNIESYARLGYKEEGSSRYFVRFVKDSRIANRF